jgi:hypothetical protein
MKVSTPSKMGESTHKITKIIILSNVKRVKGFASMVGCKKAEVHVGESG